MTLSIEQILVFVVTAGLGGYGAGRLFGCKMSILVSFAIAGLGAVTYLIPTIGAAVSYLTMIAGTWYFSDGELMESFLTAGVARLLVIPAFLGVDAMLT